MASHPLLTLYLRRRRKVLVGAGDEQLPLAYVATAMKNLERLGYTLSPGLIARLRTLSERDFTMVYGLATSTLRRLKGAHVQWTPMYPNFPAQVMEASDAELYVNALLHYFGDWIGARILPVFPVEDRPALIEATQLEVIDLGDEDELAQLARDLIGAATSISEQDREDLRVLVAHFSGDIARILPPRIPHKENLAFTTSLLVEHRVASDVLLTRYFRTATDILRLATAMSGGDVSLAKPTRFRSFKRSERRLFVALVERLATPDEDLWRHRGPWLRLAERLHPGEYTGSHPRAAAAFARLRSGERPSSFAGRVEQALRERDVSRALADLASRPGELARRLDHLLRSGDAQQAPRIVEAFQTAARDVSTPVLLQVMAHFEHRTEHAPVRPIFPKGSAAKVIAVPNELPPLAEEPCRQIVDACERALVDRFGTLAPLGKVYIDPRLASHLVPYSQRSASKALRTLVRGSRIALPAGGTLRFFLWWKEGLVAGQPTGRVDIDLSAIFFSASFAYQDHVSWTNLRTGKYGVHSGDITSAPSGACEFIDLDIAKVLAAGTRYVLASAYAFTSQPFCNLPECFTGWMMRSEPGSGEIFEPATVVDRVDLAADGRVAVPAIFDLRTREVIWTDIGYRVQPRAVAAVETRRTSLAQLVQAMHVLRKPTLYRLFQLHARARGTLVEREAEAETVFGIDRGITPFDQEAIMARFLVDRS